MEQIKSTVQDENYEEIKGATKNAIAEAQSEIGQALEKIKQQGEKGDLSFNQVKNKLEKVTQKFVAAAKSEIGEVLEKLKNEGKLPVASLKDVEDAAKNTIASIESYYIGCVIC